MEYVYQTNLFQTQILGSDWLKIGAGTKRVLIDRENGPAVSLAMTLVSVIFKKILPWGLLL